MNREHWKAMLPIITAWVDGKPVQGRVKLSSSGWDEIHFAGQPNFHRADIEWRIKPEPQLRPWRSEEVPVGAMTREKRHSGVRRMIIGVDACGEIELGALASGIKPAIFLRDWTLLDGSPCGVEERE